MLIRTKGLPLLGRGFIVTSTPEGLVVRMEDNTRERFEVQAGPYRVTQVGDRWFRIEPHTPKNIGHFRGFAAEPIDTQKGTPS